MSNWQLWCESHGLGAERLKHLARAVLSDPKNVTVRGLLGLIAAGSRWETAERARERMKADDVLAAKLAEYERRRSKLDGRRDPAPAGVGSRGAARR